MTNPARSGELVVGYVLHRYPELSQTFVRLEIDELRRQGVRVEVVALARGTGELGASHEVHWLDDDRSDKRWRLELHRLLVALSHPRRYLAARRLLAELGSEAAEVRWQQLPLVAARLRQEGVSWLHAHFAWSGAAAAALLATLLDLPWSMTMHANDIFGDRRNLELKLAAATHLVTVCDYNRRWLDEHHHPQRPLSVVVCGVEVPPEVSSDPEVDVVAVGRLVEKKGFDTLIEAAAELRHHRPHLSIEIIGDGPLRSALDERIAQHGLREIVKLRGALPHDETLERISRGRVFCLPARIAENGDRDSMPVVVKEAMVRGVPVVVSDAVGLPEMVDHTCGWIVPPGDPRHLATALTTALDDPEEARRRGAAARRRVVQRFTLAGEVAKLRQIFETAPEGRQRA